MIICLDLREYYYTNLYMILRKYYIEVLLPLELHIKGKRDKANDILIRISLEV